MNHVLSYGCSSQEVTQMVADAIAFRLYLPENAESMWTVVVGTAAEKHVVVHVFSETFVTVKRVKLPLFVELYPQFIKQQSDYYQKDN